MERENRISSCKRRIRRISRAKCPHRRSSRPAQTQQLPGERHCCPHCQRPISIETHARRIECLTVLRTGSSTRRGQSWMCWDSELIVRLAEWVVSACGVLGTDPRGRNVAWVVVCIDAYFRLPHHSNTTACVVELVEPYLRGMCSQGCLVGIKNSKLNSYSRPRTLTAAPTTWRQTQTDLSTNTNNTHTYRHTDRHKQIQAYTNTTNLHIKTTKQGNLESRNN